MQLQDPQTVNKSVDSSLKFIDKATDKGDKGITLRNPPS